MSVEEIKGRIAALTAREQSEISAFLLHLRRVSDPKYQEHVESRLTDQDPGHWLTPEEFERQLDQQL